MSIIVATDFTKLADNAVAYAAAMAKHTSARLVLFHAYSWPIHAANAQLSAEYFQSLFQQYGHRLEEQGKLIGRQYGIEVSSECAVTYIEDSLPETIEKYNGKLLIMGMKGKSLEQDLMGNTTTSMIKKINIPILAVPEVAQWKDTRKMLFACDMSSLVPQDVLQRLKEFAASFQGEVEVFSVDKVVEDLQKEKVDPFKEDLEGIHYYYKNVRSQDVIAAIAAEIKEIKADFLVMMPQKRGFGKPLFTVVKLV